jgi:DNA-binding CsgD family transcriptional regulator
VSNKRWTKDEENFLVENWGRLKISEISKKINRTNYSVATKAYRLNLNSQIYHYGATEVSEILGISRKNVKVYIDQNKLKASRDKTNKKRYVITESSIMKFMKEYKDLWDTRKVTICLYTRKPSWYIEKEISDKNRSIKRYSRWSITETKILIDRYRRSYTLEEIAKEIGRSKSSIKNKIKSIDYGRKVVF